MKVWLGYTTVYDFDGVEKTLDKVFDSELKAKEWVEAGVQSDYEWREYEEKTVE